MISRVICARRVCLSCRLGISQRAAALPRTLPTQRDLGRRRFASAQDVSKNDILEALMSGRRTVGKKAGKKEELPSWDVEPAESSKPDPKKDSQDQMRPIWEEMEEQATPSWGAKGDLEGTRQEPKEHSEKQASAELDPEGSSPATNETIPLRRVEEEASKSQNIFERPTEADMGEPLGGEPLETDAADIQQQQAERKIGRSISDEDFSYWAADEHGNPRKTSETSQRAQKPYIIGRTRLDRQNVGLGALGQKFDALVMNDPDALGHREGRFIPSHNELPPSIALDPETFSRVEEPGMEPDEEAFLNLDSLRPTMSSTLTRHDFESLRDMIAEGFNGSQLILYWQRHRDPDVKPVDASAAYTWLKDLGTWKPVDEEIYPTSRETKAKISYANRIMTQIWGLQVQEEVEMPGRVTAKLATVPHTLISSPAVGFLQAIKAEVLDETIGESITSTKSNKSLTIVARKPVVPVVLARIETILRSMDKQRVSLDKVPRDIIKRENLDELEKVTRTIILMDPAPGPSYIDVCWPRAADMDGASEPATGRETPADTVRRLLLGRHVPVRTAEEQIVAKRFRGEGVAAKAGTLTPYHRETRSMSWKDRLAPWARFIIPAPAELKKVRWLKLPDRVSLPHMDETSVSNMDLVTATFGHILHSPLRKPKTRGRSKTSYRRIISPVMPHPAAFTDLFPREGFQVTKKSFIVIHFIPAPGTASAGTAPALKLTMPFTGDEDFSNFTLPKKSTLHAPKSSFVKDILFPEEVVDARVEHHRDLKLDISEQRAFQDFIDASEFDPAEGRLQTPSETRFSIPQAWLTKFGKEGEQGEDTIDLPYLFGGLEIRQTLDLPWDQNITVRYESIEAGQHGGTRQELSLVLDLAERETSTIQPTVRDFLWKLGDVVEGKFWSWSKGVTKLKELPPDNDQIWNRVMPEPALESSDFLEDAPTGAEVFEVQMDEPGAPVDGFDDEIILDEGSGVTVPRSEVIDWTSAPMAPPPQHQETEKGSNKEDLVALASERLDALASQFTVAEPERTAADETSSISAAQGPQQAPDTINSYPSPTADGETASPAETDPQPAAPSTTQTSTGPFSPTSSKQKDHRPKNILHDTTPADDGVEDAELARDTEEYENLDPEALAARLEAEAGSPSLEELYRRAGATPEQIAALQEESKRFEEQWKQMYQNSPSGEEEPRSREEVEAEDKMLKQLLAEDIARIEKEEWQTEEELDEDDDMEVDPAEEKRKKKLRKRRG